MKLATLDRHPSGSAPLALCLLWLDTLTRSPAVTWAPGQLAAAQQAVAEARELYGTDVATLAGRASVARDECDDEGCPHYGTDHGHEEAPADRLQSVYAALDAGGEGVDLRSVAEAVAGAVPPGTDVRLSIGDGYDWRPAK